MTVRRPRGCGPLLIAEFLRFAKHGGPPRRRRSLPGRPWLRECLPPSPFAATVAPGKFRPCPPGSWSISMQDNPPGSGNSSARAPQVARICCRFGALERHLMRVSGAGCSTSSVMTVCSDSQTVMTDFASGFPAGRGCRSCARNSRPRADAALRPHPGRAGP